jgi:membrane protein implicated in regulation of membrane protease activity
MRPWQNAIALAATVLACGALLPLAPHLRIACAGVAFAIIVGLLAARLRLHAVRRTDARSSGVYDRIERMRAQRGERRRR